MLRLPQAADAAPLLRSYSLSGEPSATRYRVSVKKNPNGVAGAYIRDRVKFGDILGVSAPQGTFTLEPGAGPIVLLSVGIGVTPVLAMLHALAAAKSPRDVWWIHGARHGGEHPFAEEARACLKTLSHTQSHIRYSPPRPEDRLGAVFDAPGRVDICTLEELDVPRDAEFYICGPLTFITDLTTSLNACGVTGNRIRSEIFGAGSALTPGIIVAPLKAPHLPAGIVSNGPLVSFARTGLSVRWSPAFESVLELAEACDVRVRWSCRVGVCHVCETTIFDGAVSYSIAPVRPPSDGTVLICCSRPGRDIVIDL